MIGIFFAGLVVIGVAILVIVGIARRKRRRDSLHRSDDGTVWIWTDFDGTQRSSSQRPDQLGGEWQNGGGAFGSGGGSDGGSADGGGGD